MKVERYDDPQRAFERDQYRALEASDGTLKIGGQNIMLKVPPFVKVAAGVGIGALGVCVAAVGAYGGLPLAIPPLLMTAAGAYALDVEKPGTVGRGMGYGALGLVTFLGIALFTPATENVEKVIFGREGKTPLLSKLRSAARRL